MTYASREQDKQYKVETYQWRKAHKICVNCGRQDAAIGFVQCGECIEKKNNKYHANAEKSKACVVARMKRLQEAGLCITCGNKRSERSKRYCDKCLEKRRLWTRNYRKKNKVYMSLEREAEVHRIREESLKKAVAASMASPKAQAHRKAYMERQLKKLKVFFYRKGGRQ